mgnify:CR=1 FL=1
MGLPAEKDSHAIVRAVVAMAQSLRIRVVAEGVETAAQRDYLQSLQCACYQGFLCSPGLPATDFERLVAQLPK